MQPNIILIVSDQHRRDWLGTSGSAAARLVSTPILDALAASGARFTSAYCPATICAPSRMSLMCGRYPHQLGVYINEHTLRGDAPTFAHALGRAGYQTVLCGRMHFSGFDQRHGFEERLVGDWNASYAGGTSVWSEAERRETSNSHHAAQVARTGESSVMQLDSAIVAGAERFLQDRAASQENRPLLLVTGFFQPHHPFVAPEADVERAMSVMTEPLAEALAHPALVERAGKQRANPGSPEQILRARAVYAGMIANLDRYIGRVLAAARATLSGPTLVIYTTDHGEMAGDFGLWGKTVFYEASAGVPLIIAPLHPDRPIPGLPLSPNRCITVPVNLTDLAPTLTDLAQAPALPGMVGRSLLPLLADPAADAHREWKDRPVFSELCLRLAVDGKMALNDPAQRMIRRGPWKLVYYSPVERTWTNPVTLHHLERDPDECQNLADEPTCADIREDLLRGLLADWSPARMSADADMLAMQAAYITAWGRQHGQRVIGRLEQFDPTRPSYRFGLPGVVIQS